MGESVAARFEVVFNDYTIKTAEMISSGGDVAAVASGHPVSVSSEYDPTCGPTRVRIDFPTPRQGC